MQPLSIHRLYQIIGSLLSIGMLFAMPANAAELETSTSQAIPQHPSALPDLIIQSITVTPADFAAGDEVDITITVKNQGDAKAGTFSLYLYVDPTQQPPITTTLPTRAQSNPTGLPANGTISIGYTRVLTSTDVALFAWVDRDNKVAESNETNNLGTLYTAGKPDPFEDDPNENDDSCADAVEITVGAAAQVRNLVRQGGQPDSDWVTFEATAGSEYLISAQATGADIAPLIKSTTHCDDQTLGDGKPRTLTLRPLTNTRYYLEIYNSTDIYGDDNGYLLDVKSVIPCADFPESNNSCANSSLLTTTTQQSAFCANGDVDWYRFPVVAGGRYTVTATNLGNNANLALRLFESCTSGGSENSLQQSFIASQPGLVYLQLQQTNFGIETDYSLDLQQDLTTGCDVDNYDKPGKRNDQRTSATTITPNQPQLHNSCPARDVDWVQFASQTGKNYTIESSQLASKADTKLCLYDASGNQLQCDDDSGAGNGSRIYLTNSNGGIYYAQISQLDEQLAGPATQYQLQLLENECQPDAYEPDDQRQNAKTIDPVNPYHNICQRYDVDWVRFSAQARTPYIIESRNLDPDADTILELYNDAGELLASNDDFSPGIQSRINYTAPVAGNYFVKIKLYNASKLGEGTRYAIDIRPGIAQPWSPQSFPPSAGHAQPPTPSTGIYRTLILFNYEQIAALYSAAEADQLLQKLKQLAAEPTVKGEIVRLDETPEVAAAYSAWLADKTSIGRANQVANTIRNLINRIRQDEGKLEYLVLVGDDQAIPFYRMLDEVPDQDQEDVEEEYFSVNTAHPTGIALRGNYYLTDDYYAARLATVNVAGSDLYIPDIAIGRLIETPQDMLAMIDHFLAHPVTQVSGVLVTGWDFASDVALENCTQWQTYQNNPALASCSLIGNEWTKSSFDTLRLGNVPTFNIQSINGHANHFADTSPLPVANNLQTADEILARPGDIRGGLIYSMGCHGGLNVPPANSGASGLAFGNYRPLDLAEAFVRRGANYIGNTGYGYGQYGVISHSEKLMLYLTKEIEHEPYGKALMIAKQQFLNELLWESLSPYEKKVSQELVYYGLPMYRIPASGGNLGEEFPGVDFTLSDPNLGALDVISYSAKLDLKNGKFKLVSTAAGDYLTLSNHATTTARQSVQPVFYSELSGEFRSVIMREGTYSITNGANPVIASPINEYSTITNEQKLITSVGWNPAYPLSLQKVTISETTVIAAIGQFNAQDNRSRQYGTINLDLLSSEIMTDSTPPQVTVVDARLNEATQQVAIKVGAVDASGIFAIVVVYFEETTSQGIARSLTLAFDPAQQKWIGTFSGGAQSRFFVQVIDNAAMATIVTDKGKYFAAQPAAPDNPSSQRVYLPTIMR